MGIMDTVHKPGDRPIIATICGDAGTGKTSLAAAFPKPIFIRAEDGLQAIPANIRPDAFPILKSGEDLWEQLMALLKEDHSYRTLVIDSVSTLERIFIQDVMNIPDKDGKLPKSLNTALGGYGAGRSAVASMHQRVRKAAGYLNERKGMNVIFVAHADVQTMRLPDTDDYQRYSLRLMETSMAPYVDDVDLVGFIRLVSYVRGEDGERKRAVSTGDREIVCHSSAASVSKNRYGIVDAIDVNQGENPLADIIPSINGAAKPATAKTDPKKAPAKAVTEEPAIEKETAQ